MRLRRAHFGGFTLLEVIVTIAVVMLLVGTVVAVSWHGRTAGRARQTELTLEAMVLKMQTYLADGCAEPAAGAKDFVSKLQAYEKTRQSSPPMPGAATVLDGYGQEIVFEPSGGGKPWRFRSVGADGVSGTADDVLNP